MFRDAIYKVYLWSGSGYKLDTVEVEASHEEHALELAVVKGLGWTFEEGSEDFNELFYMDEDSDDGDGWHYLDLSEYDKPNVYIYLENAKIELLEVL